MPNPALHRPREPDAPRNVAGQMTVEAIGAAMDLLPKAGPQERPRQVIVSGDTGAGTVKMTFKAFSFGTPAQWLWRIAAAEPFLVALPVRRVRWRHDMR